MSLSDSVGCREYQQLSRRQFLARAGGTAAALSAPSWLPRIALAEDDRSGRDVIVSIFLRGASDGLTLCVPHGESAYYAARPTLSIPRPDSLDPFRAIDLDGFFGFPQALSPLIPAYQAGHLLVVHASGSTDPSRSHFDAQRFMEVGKPNDLSLTTGWLGRHLASVSPAQMDTPLRAVGVGFGLPRNLQGGPDSLPIPDLENFGLTGASSTLTARTAVLQDMYALVEDPIRAAAQTTQVTVDLLNTIDFRNYQPAGRAIYPTNRFGRALESTAALIKADVGVEAVSIDLGGWDTHNNQGPTNGPMANLMSTLGNGLGAFHADLFSGREHDVTVVAMSEFGRRLNENGSLGTDHGHGNVMLVMGNAIAGGRVLTEWPGLDRDQLYQNRDLEVTIDYRDVLAEIVLKRLGNHALGVVFPGFRAVLRHVTLSPGDFDHDGDVDLADFLYMSDCFSGPGVQSKASCCRRTEGRRRGPCNSPADLDGDDDVDIADLVAFQSRFTGSR